MESLHKLLVLLCEASYNRRSFVVNDVEFLIDDVHGCQVVAIRGTEANGMLSKGGWRDVLMDLRIGPSGYYGLRGHAGFLSGAKAIEKVLLDALDKSAPVIVTGHSLGGGIAIPVARMLLANHFDVKELVTFGCPRCITKGHNQFKSIEISQYEYRDDVVPTFQFWSPRKHFNRLSIGGARSKNWFFNRNWKDHNIFNYVDFFGA